MSVITDFVVASVGEAAQLDDEDYLDSLPNAPLPGLTQMKLASLLWLCRSKKGKINSIKQIPLVHRFDEKWVYRIPDDLVEKLAELDAKASRALAGQWFREEDEFQFGGWEESNVYEHLKTIKTLSRKALKDRKQLWMRQML